MEFEPKNLGVIVCGCVFNNEKPILYVYHGEKDWQFLCGDKHDSIEGSKASLTIKSIHEKVSETAIEAEETKQEKKETKPTTTKEDLSEEKNLTWLWIAIGIILVILIGIGYKIKKR